MPPPIIAAGIAAGGSIIGGVIASSGASKAAKAQQTVAQQQIAANNANRDYVTGLEQPTIDRGNWAGKTYAALLGYGDQGGAKVALDTWRNSVGYQDLLNTGFGAVKADAYARGMGDSGATMKALQARGMALADQNQGVYMSNLNNLIQTGNSAIGNVAGVSTQTTGANNAANQNAADATSSAALANGSNWNKVITNLTNIGMNAMGPGGFASSYSHPASNGTGSFQSGFDIPNVRYDWMN
jgi:hypothetical protein